MKRYSWQILLGLSLLAASALGYIVQDLIFNRPEDTFFYLFQDLAFVPFQVLLVSLVINALLRRRESEILRHKMNMVIGAFFSEAGNTMLRYFSQFDTHLEKIQAIACVKADWTSRDFIDARKRLDEYDYTVDCRCADLKALKNLLISQRQTLLNLLSNPNLIEHESFTELLWAVFHLTEEMSYRVDLDNLPDPDYEHLATDMRRAYVLLTAEWLLYAKHLREDYPFMFAFITRVNPFQAQITPVIED